MNFINFSNNLALLLYSVLFLGIANFFPISQFVLENFLPLHGILKLSLFQRKEVFLIKAKLPKLPDIYLIGIFGVSFMCHVWC